MGNSRNPNSNSIVQALLDASDLGYGTMTVDQLITKTSTDGKLRAALQAKWNAHAYPDKAMEWAQLTKSQTLMTLSDPALKILTFFGMYCHQSTLLQVSLKDLAAATGIKDRTLRYAMKELSECGCIRIEKPSAQHAAPIYSVNPAIINKGTRRRSEMSEFCDKLSCSDYLLTRDLPLIVQTQTICQEQLDGSKIAYNRVALVTPETAALQQSPKRRKRTKSDPDEQLPGQMSLADFPEVFNE